MKKLYTLLTLVITLITFAQAPQGFNYQATVRNSAGALIVNQNVNFKFNVMLNSSTSLPVFSETHMAPTDDLGQVNLVIGTGTATIGTFSTINWGTGNYYLGIELNTGAGYVAMGTTQLLSVPYALYANSSGNAQTPTPNLAAVLAVNNSANNTKITNLANPIDAQDATNKVYVDAIVPNGILPGDIMMWNGTDWDLSSNLLPKINTTQASSITSNSCQVGGEIISIGGSNIIRKGICYSEQIFPTLADTKIYDTSSNNSFSLAIQSLASGVSYHLKSFAENSFGITYGQEITLTTLPALPSLTTTPVTSISNITAISGGNITNDGGGAIISRGVVWATTANPTITSNIGITTNGTSVGTFTSYLTGLTSATLYYVRAYATNSLGTAYGNEISFSTLPGIATLTTTEISQLLYNSVTTGGNITFDGGATIITRGICWSTLPNPTNALTTKTIDGSGNGIFSSIIPQLTPATTYYVKAYAINSIGTAYGNQISFVSQNTDNQSEITIGSQIWSTRNLDVTTYRDGTPIPQVTDPSAWTNLTTGAWCYKDNSITSGALYGKLYNWYAVAGIHDTDPNTPNKILAPLGWHVPTNVEWTTLTTYLGGESVSGGKMKSIEISPYWNTPNTLATNESGFTGLPGGGLGAQGALDVMRSYGNWWSSSESSTINAFTRHLFFNNGTTGSFSNGMKYAGLSVRLVKD